MPIERTEFVERIPLTEREYTDGEMPKDSSIIPHSVSSIKHDMVTDYICRVKPDKVDTAVDQLLEYLY
ncbi:MAG: hypothetical protein SXQ77_11545 [Halobacteria archaeon]|nr:hypothetical protein [Halobacteria archaeon]